jgi:DNA primase
LPGQAGQVKQELLITRVAQRLGLRQETVWARLGELKAARRRRDADRSPSASPRTPAENSAESRARPARTIEKELLQILLAEPALVSQAYTTIRPEEVEHPGLQQLLAGMYSLWEQGESPDLDELRATIDNPALMDWAIDNQDIGRDSPDRGGWFRSVLDRFRTDRLGLQRQRLMDRLRAAATEDERQRLLRQIQDLSKGPPDPQSGGPSP